MKISDINTKVTVWQVSLNGDIGFVLKENELTVLIDEAQSINEGDELSIKKIEIEAEKLESLPEFEGW